MPDAVVEDRALHLWYGDRDDPVLRLRPISLPDDRV
jgi:hypothetical protein